MIRAGILVGLKRPGRQIAGAFVNLEYRLEGFISGRAPRSS